MSHPNSHSPLLTDFYQLTMAYGYWKLGMHEQPANFHLMFRSNPFKGNHAICAGLASAIHFLSDWQFKQDDLDYLAGLKNIKGESVFSSGFLDYLASLSFSCDIHAIPEGTVVFPQTPLLRVQGPLLQCQLIESSLLNIINFQTLIATKAARVCRAAGNDEVIEFGMRRAQGPDGALSASRAAYIGGCSATSNTLAGKYFDIPVRGTHAHSWVTAFKDEQTAFDSYASVMPHNCILLVDTYNTIEGVKHAINTGKKLREEGADLQGIRLDSGDMASLSIEARKLLDDAGFKNTIIFASNSLDENIISEFKANNACVTAWGVGTNLVTAYDQPALDGVYKLSALQNQQGQWEYKLKLSEQEVKISNPGRQQVRRYFDNNKQLMDVLYEIDLGIDDKPCIVSLDANSEETTPSRHDNYIDLLKPVLAKGELIAPLPSIHETRKYCLNNLSGFYQHYTDKEYLAGIEKKLQELKTSLINEYK